MTTRSCSSPVVASRHGEAIELDERCAKATSNEDRVSRPATSKAAAVRAIEYGEVEGQEEDDEFRVTKSLPADRRAMQRMGVSAPSTHHDDIPFTGTDVATMVETPTADTPFPLLHHHGIFGLISGV
jgi:hypothetical protein